MTGLVAWNYRSILRMNLKIPYEAKLNCLAHAKLNLILRVHEPVLSGLHAIESLIAPISIHDSIEVALCQPDLPELIDGISLQVEIVEPLAGHMRGGSSGEDPLQPILSELQGPANLAARAARAIVTHSGLLSQVGVRIRLIKRIPIGAGLGGGSSDAATVLLALNKLLSLHLSETQLQAIGSSLGSDIAAMIAKRLIFVHGTGNQSADLEELSSDCGGGEKTRLVWPALGLVVLKPCQCVSTRDAYARLDSVMSGKWRQRNADPRNDERLVQALSTFRLRIAEHCHVLPTALRTRGDQSQPAGAIAQSEAPQFIDGMALLNDFEKVVPSAYPEVGQAIDLLRTLHAGPVILAGSGSAVAGLCRSESEAEALRRRAMAGAPDGWYVESACLLTEAPWLA